MRARAGSSCADTALHVRSWSLAALLAALAMLGPFAIDMYLPSFEAIRADFEVSPIAVQQTLSAYLFAFAFMMLWHGALSDALGRRPVVAGRPRGVRRRVAGLRDRRQHPDAMADPHDAGPVRRRRLVVGRAIVRDRFQGAKRNGSCRRSRWYSASRRRWRR